MSARSVLRPIHRINPNNFFSLHPSLQAFGKIVSTVHGHLEQLVLIFASSHIMQSTSDSQCSISFLLNSLSQNLLHLLLVHLNHFPIFLRTFRKRLKHFSTVKSKHLFYMKAVIKSLSKKQRKRSQIYQLLKEKTSPRLIRISSCTPRMRHTSFL